ncbi:Gldg family protein [Leptospira saintgironsiae]|uniref:Uncharacterized protein n=1 Tax=Leptospira saintgironsiae TaxID=2023183 RepID=A0A2M9YGR9_9LEPT|nr:Gldg family protein [Leptospira saintgironsiae]PJZ50709.1 hypothetical protein CH362_02785 [Leptospira saintgironsiae]
MKSNLISRILSWASIVLLLLFFPIYESFSSAGLRWATSIIVLSVIAGSGFLSYIGSKKEDKEINLLISSGLGIISLGIYFLRVYLEDLSLQKGGTAPVWITNFREFLLVFLVLFVLGSVFLGILREWERSSFENQSSLKGRKQSLVRDFFLGTGILLLILILANYISVMRNHNFDLSSKGVHSFSIEAKKILKEIPEGAEVDVIAFYPRPLDSTARNADGSSSLALKRIRPDLEILLSQMVSIHPGFKVKFINADVELDEIAEFGQVSNGNILIRFRKAGATAGPYPEQKVGVKDKSELEDLERRLVQAFMNVTTKERKVYFTEANGERYSQTFQNLPNEKLVRFADALSFLNFKSTGIGFQNNWPSKIPDDAEFLVIAGPTVPFSPEAKVSILDFVFKKKGKLFITIEQRGGESFDWLLQEAGYSFAKGNLSQSPGRAPGLILTKAFRDHAIEESLSKKDTGIVFPYGGYFEQKPSSNPSDMKLDASILLETGGDVYIDKNGNGKQEKEEEKKNLPIALVLKTKAAAPVIPAADPNAPPTTLPETKSEDEGRIVIYSGTSWITNQYIPYEANYELAGASVTWMYQDVSLPAIAPKKEEIETVSLTDGQKRAVWILGMFLFPGLIAGLGSIYVIKRKKAGQKDAK